MGRSDLSHKVTSKLSSKAKLNYKKSERVKMARYSRRATKTKLKQIGRFS